EVEVAHGPFSGGGDGRGVLVKGGLQLAASQIGGRMGGVQKATGLHQAEGAPKNKPFCIDPRETHRITTRSQGSTGAGGDLILENGLNQAGLPPTVRGTGCGAGTYVGSIANCRGRRRPLGGRPSRSMIRWIAMIPSISVSGRGGQPGTYTSTGMN